ncbi:MAG: DUF1211 domain-containing protein [Bacteroidetes bacterium]|nr:MAG: DUF1211 domain-containing protein [Bacteroidota bacterium]
MLRAKAAESGFGAERNFRWRGGDVSRIEGFSDNVFGFALTLLVVSLEVPKTFSDLSFTLGGFVAFGLAFALLSLFWFEHYRFFRRYGIEDRFVLVMNFFLLFVVLFFVYPLKFLFTFLVRMFGGARNEVLLPDGTVTRIIETHQWPTMMVTYAVGFMLIYLCFFLLYRHAYRFRAMLELTPEEVLLTRAQMTSTFANIAVGFASAMTVIIGGPAWAAVSGWMYGLIGPLQGIIGYRTGRALRAMTEPSGRP